MKYGRITLILFVTLCTAVIFSAEYVSGDYDEGGFTRLHITYVDANGNEVGRAHGHENLHGHASPHLTKWHSGNCIDGLESYFLIHPFHGQHFVKEHDKDVTRVVP